MFDVNSGSVFLYWNNSELSEFRGGLLRVISGPLSSYQLDGRFQVYTGRSLGHTENPSVGSIFSTPYFKQL